MTARALCFVVSTRMKGEEEGAEGVGHTLRLAALHGSIAT